MGEPSNQPRVSNLHIPSNRVPKRVALKPWAFEVLVLGIALGSFAAIIVVLWLFNGEESPAWRYSINLNSLVAILSTVLRAALMIPVAESISQMKWIWFTKPNKLRLIERFDDASRGSWGSAVLLTKIVGLNLASVGTLVTMVSLAIGPFTQQAVKSVLCDFPVPGSLAGVPVARYLLPRSDDIGTGGGHTQTWTLRDPMILALFKGLMETTSNDVLPIACATGNCTFGQGPGGSYASLGVCSKCADITSKLELVHAGSWPVYRLPGNLSVQVGTREPLSVNFNINTTTSSLAQTEWTDSSIVTLTVNGCVRTNVPGNFGWDCPHSAQNTYDHLRDDDSLVPINERSVVAAQCTLYPCARLYSGEIRQGLLRETILATFPAALPPKYKTGVPFSSSGVDALDNYTAIIEPCVVGGKLYDRFNFSSSGLPSSEVSIGDTVVPVPSQCVYNMPVSWGAAFRREGFTTTSAFCFPVVTSDPEVLYPSVECASNRWLNPLFNNGNASFESISTAFDRMALAVTNRMRIIGMDEHGNPLKAEGQTMETRVCIRVNWYWLVLPGSLAVLVVFLLAGTVVQSEVHRQTQPVWKSSLLPSLFYGLRSVWERDGGNAVADRPAELKMLQEMAESTVVRFRPRGENSHLEPVEE
ncbi:hypothetical protein OQA88_2313 [Cercophora sp. LCS_1]